MVACRHGCRELANGYRRKRDEAVWPGGGCAGLSDADDRTNNVLEWMNSRARTSNFVSLFRLSLVSLLPLLLFAHQLWLRARTIAYQIASQSSRARRFGGTSAFQPGS